MKNVYEKCLFSNTQEFLHNDVDKVKVRHLVEGYVALYKHRAKKSVLNEKWKWKMFIFNINDK